MSRGDEIEPGQPKPSAWASGDYHEQPEDDDRVRITKPQRSGAVTAVGVIAIIWGVWMILVSGCLALLPLAMPALMAQAAKANPNDPNIAKANEIMARTPQWYLIATAGVQLLSGLALAIGGIGVLQRSNTARLLLIAVAIVGIVVFAGNLAINLAMSLLNSSNMYGSVCDGLITLAFAIFVCTVLLNSKNAAEFRT